MCGLHVNAAHKVYPTFVVYRYGQRLPTLTFFRAGGHKQRLLILMTRFVSAFMSVGVRFFLQNIYNLFIHVNEDDCEIDLIA